MLKRLCIAVLAGIIGLALFVPSAYADPKTRPITSTCDNGQTVQNAFEGNGNFTPGHLLSGTGVFVTQSIDATREFTPTGGTTITTGFHVSKPHLTGDLVTCTFDVTVVLPDGIFHAFGSSVFFLTPAS